MWSKKNFGPKQFMGPIDIEAKKCWVKKNRFKNILGLEKFWIQKDLSQEKMSWFKIQDKFGPDKCHLDKCLKPLGSTYLCEFRLLTKIDGLRVGRWFPENNATFWAPSCKLELARFSAWESKMEPSVATLFPISELKFYQFLLIIFRNTVFKIETIFF